MSAGAASGPDFIWAYGSELFSDGPGEPGHRWPKVTAAALASQACIFAISNESAEDFFPEPVDARNARIEPDGSPSLVSADAMRMVWVGAQFMGTEVIWGLHRDFFILCARFWTCSRI